MKVRNKQMNATVTSKGQVTIPVEARKELRIRPGTKLEFVIKDNGRLEIIPLVGSVRSLKGAVPKPYKTLTVKEMDEAIADGARR
jgi:antitoxin PrlF